MDKHTPGPWAFVNGRQIRSERDQIASVWMMRGGEGTANAALIAAAPDLLAALQGLLAACEGARFASDPFDAVPVARAAIAKATGA